MLTNITFSLPEKTVKRLRKSASDRGGRKGAISEMVDRALISYLDRLDEASAGERFFARKGETTVAEADSLEELAEALKSKGVDWRTCLITSSEPLASTGHLGFRTTPA